ncbi:MAG TPA: N-acetylglucosamine-6-phosphate deacetylase, partial [Thermomicrobiales bacterium]|nr:N-acetylglucosamine-6-phosphate deacetylase [Thermomicrobiales bacterium]
CGQVDGGAEQTNSLGVEFMTGPTVFAIRGRLLFGTSIEQGTLVVDGDRIEAIQRGLVRDGNLPHVIHDVDLVSPGLIDLQVNGADGVEADDDPRHIEHISRWSVASGVTAWLPTVVTSAADFYPSVFEGWSQVDTTIGAKPLGFHLEGPFLAPARKGAHRLDLIEAAPDSLFDLWLEQQSIKLVTLAPDRPGAIGHIHRLREHGIVVSLGHTDSTYDAFESGVDAGATMATHLFNAMSPMHHRNPGAMIATMTDDRVTAGLIPDAVHSHPAAVRLAMRAKGPDRIAIVSDMMSATGLPSGTFQIGRRDVTVAGDSVTLPDGTLAGSVLTMDRAVQNLVEWAGVSTAEALHMCSCVPANVLGDASRGRLIAGARSDLTIWSSDLQVQQTIVGGTVRFDQRA